MCTTLHVPHLICSFYSWVKPHSCGLCCSNYLVYRNGSQGKVKQGGRGNRRKSCTDETSICHHFQEGQVPSSKLGDTWHNHDCSFFFSLAVPHDMQNLSFPDQGWNPRPLQWKQGGVLTIRPPGKSHDCFLKTAGCTSVSVRNYPTWEGNIPGGIGLI